MQSASPAHIMAATCDEASSLGFNLTQVGSNSHCCKAADDSDAESWSVLIGILMGLVGSVMINIGQNLQAMAMQSSPAVKAKPCTSRTWVTGLSVVSTTPLTRDPGSSRILSWPDANV